MATVSSTKVYSDLYQTSKMERFENIVIALIVYARHSILDVWQGSKYASDESKVKHS